MHSLKLLKKYKSFKRREVAKNESSVYYPPEIKDNGILGAAKLVS